MSGQSEGAGGCEGAETLEQETVFEGRVVDLRVDRVRLPHGREAAMEVVHYRGSAAVLPLRRTEDGEQVVLIRQFRYPTGGWLLEIPAGTLDGDEAPEACARRELTEETGYRCEELEPLGWIWTTPGAADERIWLYVARGLTEGETDLDPDEVLETVHLPLDEALRQAASGELHDAKTVCALLRLEARRRPG